MRIAGPSLLGVIVMTAGVVPPAHATTVEPGETAIARRWVAAKLEGQADALDQGPGYVVLANHDPVQRNARGGKSMNLAGTKYPRGLYCHATSKVVVRLPGPGKTFQAVVGVDSNEQTSGGRGSVVFRVSTGDKERFRSPLLREGMPGQTVSADLDGSSELTLEVEDGGDGISCDQSDWADARVVLQDGREIALGELNELDPDRLFSTELPFSFTYDGKPSADLLKTWKATHETKPLDGQRTQHDLTWTDPESGLEVRCTAVAYADFPVVEWTLWFRNNGQADSKRLEAIRALDTIIKRNKASEYVLHYQEGSPALATDYRPFDEPLKPGESKRFAPRAGRACDPWLPYFNIEWDGEGLIVAVGWPGQWAAEFARDRETGLHLVAGQETTSLVLRPGEAVRSPLMTLLFYQGDRFRSQNVWRRWMLAHNLPRPGGKLPPAQLAACSSWYFGEMVHADEASQFQFIDRYRAEQIKLDYWWMDAGWYKIKTDWPEVGTWEVDTNRFPGALRTITDHGREQGVRSIVWFEPERVAPDTYLSNEHPDWVLGGKDGGLLNLGDDEARAWLTEHIDGLINSQGIDLYRQDFNMDPLPCWQKADAPDRQGWTENRHVQGYLGYWDELRRRHPDMLIDSCASGGRRNDLETLRRAVPLLRSDYLVEPIGQQGHTYGISFWMPYFGTGGAATDFYSFRSLMCPHSTFVYDMRRSDLPYDQIRKQYAQWLEIRDLFFGDYYPLTPYDTTASSWMAWQFDAPEQGRGMVQAFRRPESVYESARFRLRGLDPEATYVVRDMDQPDQSVDLSGQELAERGLPVAIAERPGAVVITYNKKEGAR